LGSPNLDLLYLMMNHQTAGPPDAAASDFIYASTIRSTGENSPLFSVPADGTSAAVMVVTLRDVNGNTVSGKNVSVSTSSATAKITALSSTTSVANGAAVFKVTTSVPEKVMLSAVDTSDGLTLQQGALVVFGVPPAVSAGISANPSQVPADGQTPATIVVTLKDASNRPTPGKIVTLADGGSHAVITGPTPGVTDANGQIQFLATDQVNETVTFTATDVDDNNLPVPGSGVVTFSGSTSTECGVGVVPVAANGYAITPYITGFPAAPLLFYGNANLHCPGGNNPAFTSSGNVLASDFLTGAIYQLSLAGGKASTANLLSTLTPALSSLTYGKDGSVYATLGGESGQIVQVDPTTGLMLRVVASGYECPGGLAVDPLSGDLFFDAQCTGGGADNPSIFRIIDPANSDPSRPTSVVVYATLATTPNGGMAFAPNGTLYAVTGYFNSVTAQVEQVSATNAPSVTVTPVTGITSDFAVAIGVINPDGSAQSLIVEPAGTLTEIPIATPSAGVVLATGSPGVGVTGPDGCLYSAHYDTIYRLANSSGSCAFAPTSPAPSIKLTASASTSPAQGTATTVTATLNNVSPVAGIPVVFTIGGANAQIRLVDTDANGSAALTYTGAQAGTDAITASSTPGTSALTSNSVNVTWSAGQHVSFLTLNPSPRAATVNQPVQVAASLSDSTLSPSAALAGQSVTFSVGGSTCIATTDSTGVASCALTPSQTGTATLSASFAGTAQYTAATATLGLDTSAPPGAPTTGAPTVSLSVSPTTVAAGATATLTWSSTNASSCAAAGAWSGAEPISGTLGVTPSAVGTYTYTLTCTGDAGSATASAVLSANLVTVTVTAKSGGGSFSWSLSLLLALLVALRLTSSARERGVTFGLLLLAVVWYAPARAADSNSLVDNLYAGVKVGAMPLRFDAGRLDQDLSNAGYDGVHASTDTSAIAEAVYIGYEVNAYVGVELGYTYRESTVATLHGSIASSSSVAPLLQDTAEIIGGYGNIYSVSFRGRFEPVARFSIEPRLGAFFWDTRVNTESGEAGAHATHSGGGATVGLGAAYRIWRGLQLGLGVDYFHGSSNNLATLYSGSLEWRFGKR
jgi:Bacterial Ig-like domain (group 1)/OmpA-like transmembrane domain